MRKKVLASERKAGRSGGGGSGGRVLFVGLCVGRRCLSSRAGSSGEGTSEVASLPGLWLPCREEGQGGPGQGRDRVCAEG